MSHRTTAILAWTLCILLTTIWLGSARYCVGVTSGRIQTSIIGGKWNLEIMPRPGLLADPDGAFFDRVGSSFRWGFDVGSPSPGQWGASLALWPLVLMSLGIALWATRRLRSEIVRLPCAICGYELAGLPDSCTCPECGKRALP